MTVSGAPSQCRVEVGIRENRKISETEREALILARRGQGRFRASLQDVEHACRVTKVQRLEHLVASHVKPWRGSSNDERLDGENGLLLTSLSFPWRIARHADHAAREQIARGNVDVDDYELSRIVAAVLQPRLPPARAHRIALRVESNVTNAL